MYNRSKMITALCIYTAYSIYLFLTIYILGRGGERSTMDVVALKLRVIVIHPAWVLGSSLGSPAKH